METETETQRDGETDRAHPTFHVACGRQRLQAQAQAHKLHNMARVTEGAQWRGAGSQDPSFAGGPQTHGLEPVAQKSLHPFLGPSAIRMGWAEQRPVKALPTA